MAKNALILRKPSGTISIQLNINEQQQKMYNVLLKKVEEDIECDRNSTFFEIQLSYILNKSGVRETNYERIKELLLELYSISVEYNILGKDKDIKIEEHAHLLDNLRFTKNNNQITIRYSIPDMVRRSMIKINDGRGVYALINLTVIKHLRSKYAIKMYELVKDYKNVEVPKIDLKTFRKLFGIEDKYNTMTNLKARVLNPAVEELNNNENVDFFVEYKLIKTGKKYTHIKFHVKPKPAQLKLQQQADSLIEQEVKENTDLKELLSLIPNEQRTERLASVVLAGLESKGFDYTKAQVEYCVEALKRSDIANFSGYVKSAIEEDYAAGVKKVEIDDNHDIEDDLKIISDKYIGLRYVDVDGISEIKKVEKKGDSIAVTFEKNETKHQIFFETIENLKAWLKNQEKFKFLE